MDDHEKYESIKAPEIPDPSNWTQAQKIRYIKRYGVDAFAEVREKSEGVEMKKQLPTRNEHPDYVRVVAGYTKAKRRLVELEAQLAAAYDSIDTVIARAEAVPVDEAVGDITVQEAEEIRDAAEQAVANLRRLEKDVETQRKAVTILKGRIAQTKLDVGKEISPAWQTEYRKRLDSVANRLIKVDAELLELKEFENEAEKQGVNIVRIGRTARQHLSGLGPLGNYSVQGWIDAIREHIEYLG